MTGKTDRELIWADNANALQAHDKTVMESGKPAFLHEYVEQSNLGKMTLNVCKFIGDFEGQKRMFGGSVVIEN